MTTAREFIYAAIILFLVFVLVTCNLCKHSPAPVNTHKEDKKQIDSLQKELSKKDIIYEDTTYKLIMANNELSNANEALQKERATTVSSITMSKKRVALLQILLADAMKNKDTVGLIIGCDSLNKEFDSYIILTDKEAKQCDSLLINLAQQNNNLTIEYKLADQLKNDYKNAFNITKGKYDTLYRDYQKASKKRNVFSISLASQYHTGINTIAIGGGFQLRFKSEFAVGAKILIDTKGYKTYQGELIYPIFLKRK